MGWRHLPPLGVPSLPLGELTPQLLEGSLDMASGNVCLHVNTCVTWIQSLARSKLSPRRPASRSARSALCGDGEGRAPRPWRWLLADSSAPCPGSRKQPGGDGQRAAGPAAWGVGLAVGEVPGSWAGQGGSVGAREGKASEHCFCQPLPVSLQRGSTPQTSRNDVRIICIPLPLPARSSWEPASPAPGPEGWVSVYTREGAGLQLGWGAPGLFSLPWAQPRLLPIQPPLQPSLNFLFLQKRGAAW